VPTNIKIFHAHDFIKATPEGKLDFDASMKVFKEVASAASGVADHEILIDTRKAQSEMSVTDLWTLASSLRTFHYDFNRKTAVLCPLQSFDSEAFFALCAQNRGFRISAFVSFENAIEWLCEIEN
jgi:hypothetical protein